MNFVTERYFDFHCPSKLQQLARESFDNLLGLIAYTSLIFVISLCQQNFILSLVSFYMLPTKYF
jgi:hypothetical protein